MRQVLIDLPYYKLLDVARIMRDAVKVEEVEAEHEAFCEECMKERVFGGLDFRIGEPGIEATRDTLDRILELALGQEVKGDRT